MRLRNYIFGIIAAAVCLSACEPADPVQKHEPMPCKPYSLTKAQSEMVNGGNSFAFNLLEAVSKDEKFTGKDFMVSPLSISLLLGAMNNGATGQTSEEILNALGFENCTAADINEYSKAILQGCPEVDNLVKVKIANAVAIKEGLKLKKGFSEALSTYYDAYVRSMKFDDTAVKEINSWCHEQTEGMIPKIIDEIEPETVLIALNSIYFNGVWATQFPKDKTKKESFNGIDGKSGKVSMMHVEELFEHSSNDIWSTVRLPYGNGSYNMYVLLPHEGYSIAEVISALDADTWEAEKLRMKQRKVDLKLPAFETETEVGLVKIMKSLGMKRAFDPYQAEFNEMLGLTYDRVYLGLLKQKSKIKVNEEGTEAAAVTVGGFCGTSVQLPAEPVTFHADRPFIYLIQEQSSNAIFFIGTKVRS